MSRRSSRKVSNVASYTEIDDEIDGLTSPKKSPRKKSTEKSLEDSIVDAAPLIDSTTVTHTEASIKITTTPKKSPAKRKIKTEDDEFSEVVSPAKKSPAKRKIKVEEHDEGDTSVVVEEQVIKKGTKRKIEDTEVEVDGEVTEKTVKRKRKTKEEKEAEAMPLAERTAINSLKRAMYIGAHVSGAGGVHNSITNSLHIGGNAFALFLKSQKKWVNPPLADDVRDKFRAFAKENNYDASKHVLPHGSYLVNLAQADPEKAEQAYTCFVEDLHRCDALGIKLYNFHPGNTGPHPRPDAIARIAANLNKAHKATKQVITVLENMAGSGNVIGSTFEDLRDIIKLVDDKSRVGVCIDTCHSFAAGYDLRTPAAFKKTLDQFSEVVGLKYLMALHLNDSKAPFGSHRDLHANIGTGFLGLRAFHNVVNFEPFQNLPMVLETPIDKKGADGKVVEDKGVWATEIKLLEGLIGADPESAEFEAEEQRLSEQGAEERKKFQGQADRKQQKTIDAMFKSKGKKEKVKKEESDGEEDEGGCSH